MRQANREEAVERIVSILADCDFDNQDFLPEDFKTEGHFSQFEKTTECYYDSSQH